MAELSYVLMLLNPLTQGDRVKCSNMYTHLVLSMAHGHEYSNALHSKGSGSRFISRTPDVRMKFIAFMIYVLAVSSEKPEILILHSTHHNEMVQDW